MEKEKHEKPKYKGNLPIALWKHKDKNGKVYYTLKIQNFGNLFAYVEKKKK